MEGSKVQSLGLEGDSSLCLLGVAAQMLIQPPDGGFTFLSIARGDDEA